jgi:hypothetical protein
MARVCMNPIRRYIPSATPITGEVCSAMTDAPSRALDSGLRQRGPNPAFPGSGIHRQESNPGGSHCPSVRNGVIVAFEM